VYVSVPPYELAIGGPSPGGDLSRLATHTEPQYSMVPSGNGGRGLIGAVLQADLDPAAVGQMSRAVAVALAGKELARVVVDFGRIR
jgi:hypothetical protein